MTNSNDTTTKEKNQVLEIKKRDEKRSRAVLQEMKIVPGVIYGNGMETMPVEVEEGALADMLKKNAKTAVIPVKLDGKNINIIVKEIQRDGINPRIQHIDFQAVKKNEILEMKLPVVVEGEESVLHKRLLLNTALTEVIVKGPADLIPDNVTVDVTKLNLDDKITVGDLKLPDKIEMVTDKEELVLSINESKTAQEVELADETTESAEPVVVTQSPSKEEAKEEAK